MPHPARTMSRWVDRASRSWAAVAVLLLTWAALFGLLMAAASWFSEVAGGLDPIDLQNGLGADDVREQLARHSDAAGRYLVFAAVDLLFPLAGAALLATVAAVGFRTAAPSLHTRLVDSGGYALFLVPALLDWTENAFAVWLVVGGPPAATAAVNGLLIAKTAKLAALWASLAVVTIAVLVGAGAAVVRRSRSVRRRRRS